MIGAVRGERGSGLISTAAGVAVFLVFLLFAVQTIVALHATSTVTAAGWDAARRVAGPDIDRGNPVLLDRAQRRSETQFRETLGELGERAELHWSVDDEHVSLQVVVDAPTIFPSSIRATRSLRRIDRTFTVRTEQ